VLTRGAAILGAVLIGTGPAGAAPVDTLADLWRRLGDCARVDGVPMAAAGSEVTILFSLKRNGSLLGRPRITHARLLGSTADQHDFVAGALGAVSRCLPIPLTDGLGGAVAGRPLSFRITSHRPERAL
jgi:hypothetical protein